MVRETIEQFTKLQTLDSRIATIESQLAKIPEMLKESLERFEKVELEKTTAQDEFQQVKTEFLAAEAAAAEQANLLASAQKKLTSVQNNKEYEAALREMDNLRKNIANTEEIVKLKKAAMEELEQLISTKTAESEKFGKAYETDKSEKESENKSLFDEVGTLRREREDFAATVKKSLLSKYERIRTARQNLAVVEVFEEVCTGCNMKVPPQLAVEVKKERELLQCPYCQRFLYSDKKHEAEAAAAETVKPAKKAS
ncbi:MAG: C4-type zinc ribbon domain-containing protein [Deferribacteraceae bacterium]|jgi:predicted  nucleic acid-binding Zn-ribbon protein|nr:C4-type zinc ribbon domain-containing protein [Deferribacteraceae bacterium]